MSVTKRASRGRIIQPHPKAALGRPETSQRHFPSKAGGDLRCTLSGKDGPAAAESGLISALGAGDKAKVKTAQGPALHEFRLSSHMSLAFLGGTGGLFAQGVVATLLFPWRPRAEALVCVCACAAGRCSEKLGSGNINIAHVLGVYPLEPQAWSGRVVSAISCRCERDEAHSVGDNKLSKESNLDQDLKLGNRKD